MNGSSARLYEQAQRVIPGGVNSPVRAFRSVGATPLFIREGRGARIVDVEGRSYIDYVMSWGPLILGHAHPTVVEAVLSAVERGTSYGAPTEMEIEMAGMIAAAIPSMEMVRMVSSGTEAAMSAIRLARAFTRRDKVLKFEGCYHGHADSLLVKAGSGLATLGIPGSPGVPSQLAELTITVPFNNLSAVETAIATHSEDLACVIVEAVPANMGVVLPDAGFLQNLRRLTSERGILLIVDEVITGFRLAYGGYQDVVGIRPDLTCLGKIIGGGLPVGAFGGRRDIMEMLAPQGPVYQAGTLSGNPVAMAAGIATLKILKASSSGYRDLEQKTAALCGEMEGQCRHLGIPVRMSRIGSMFTAFFTDGRVRDFTSALASDTTRFARFFRRMLQEGVYLAPSQFEAAFVSLVHSDQDLARTAEACRVSLSHLAAGSAGD
ncbi:MAG: glutamate-1-semialdehyde 2,1-aminomutase [Syntrophales bacterium]|jgi:glutamate-1-semialdehyde 2,1-aminomutase|nr:glutamate-1-semialdehyde 2,1-aminomutase [Syntrophales bacterium]